MTLPRLRTEQHAQILGYAVIGYGISFLINLIDPLNKLFQFTSLLNSIEANQTEKVVRPVGTVLTESVWPGVVFGLFAFGLSLSAGYMIKNMNANPKPLGLMFALFAFGLFPLGTIVSVYTLIFLFVLYENEGTASMRDFGN